MTRKYIAATKVRILNVLHMNKLNSVKMHEIKRIISRRLSPQIIKVFLAFYGLSLEMQIDI